ncbi:type II secretion system F family protein [Candidatus Woesearchaeota archaeon]|nr:type II secretion system F family protein [Candidatus Woesearchaeota archaeon]
MYEKNKTFQKIGEFFAKQLPNLQVTMEQARLGINAPQYAFITVFSVAFFFSIIFSVILVVGIIKMPEQALLYATIFGGVIAISIFAYSQAYPSMMTMKRVRDLEKGTLFALRHMLIRIRSGVSLFEAMASIARGGYGAVSDEFEITIRKMASGMSQAQAMDEMAIGNPSHYFRRIIWQVSNAMKTGAEITEVVKHLVEGLSFDQRIAIRESGAQMNPIALMYMMLTVILPSMGIVFIIALSLFMGFHFPNIVFYGILLGLAFTQFMFIGIVKNRRPSIEV